MSASYLASQIRSVDSWVSVFNLSLGICKQGQQQEEEEEEEEPLPSFSLPAMRKNKAATHKMKRVKILERKDARNTLAVLAALK